MLCITNVVMAKNYIAFFHDREMKTKYGVVKIHSEYGTPGMFLLPNNLKFSKMFKKGLRDMWSADFLVPFPTQPHLHWEVAIKRFNEDINNYNAIEEQNESMECTELLSFDHFLIGQCYFFMDNFGAAIENYDNALQRGFLPTLELYEKRGCANLAMNNYIAAEKDFKELLELLIQSKIDEKMIYCWFIDGKLLCSLWHQGKYEEALNLVNKQMKFEPRSAKRIYQKAELLFELGRDEECLEELKKIENKTHDFPINILKSALILRQGNKAQANELINDVLEKKSKKYKDSAYWVRSEINLSKGDINNALSDINEAINICPDFLPFRKTLADIYFVAKNYNEAFRLYEDFLIENENEALDRDIKHKLKEMEGKIENKTNKNSIIQILDNLDVSRLIPRNYLHYKIK